jgi:hypothetical protein
MFLIAERPGRWEGLLPKSCRLAAAAALCRKPSGAAVDAMPEINRSTQREGDQI